MISVDEALEKVRASKKNFGVEDVLLADALHRILAEDIQADRDFPPYHRVTMDGIAICYEAFAEGRKSFLIGKVQAAGQPSQVLEDREQCIEVMTGAVLPENTNCVIPYEDVCIEDGSAVVTVETVTEFQNVHLRGTDCKGGSVLLTRGTRITASNTGILAAVGKMRVAVFRTPAVAVCSTGDELVEINDVPGPHQVRRSNAYMIASALRADGIEAKLFHFEDDKEALFGGLKPLIDQFDVLLFSGAVSKGKFDFLPEILGLSGLKTVFHRVAQKPGKPLLFGYFESGPAVFGLPGNPVSTFICYHLYFRAWLCESLGTVPERQFVKLAAPVTFRSKLSYHLLVSLKNRNGVLEAEPLTGSGSGDLPGLAAASGFISLPAEGEEFNAGELFSMVSF